MSQKLLREIAVELMRLEKSTGEKRYYALAEQLIAFARKTVCKQCNGNDTACTACGGDGVIKEKIAN